MKNLPFDKPGRFYKGNLHAHSDNSDGPAAGRRAWTNPIWLG